MRVSVVVVNWSGIELLKKNFPYLIISANYTKNLIYEVIVVDNGSTDDSVSYLRGLNFSKLKIIENRKNFGFTAAVNQGVRLATGEIICSLNNDVRPTKNFLEKALNLFSDNRVFAVSLHEKGEGPPQGKFEHGFVEFTRGQESNEIQNTFWVSGGSGLFRKNVWDKLGGFAKMFTPGYWEDLDICFRAVKRGYSLLWAPEALVYHQHESTSKRLSKSYIDLIKERNQLLMIWKNVTSVRLINSHLFGLLRRLFSYPGYVKVVFFAALKLPVVLKGRKKEKDECIVTDEEVLGIP